MRIFTCPECARTSHHPQDDQHGYCGACRDVTSRDQRVWDDDAHGGAVMRVHVYQRRVDDLLASFKAHALRVEANRRGIVSGGTKVVVAERLVEAGFTAGDLRTGTTQSRFTQPTTEGTAP